MSLILMAVYWVVIPVLILLLARWLLRRTTIPFHKGLVVAVSAAVFLGWFWLVAGEKLWLDHQVRELCAKDGGVRVYETVKLPGEKFNQWGQIKFYRPDQGENALGPEYVFKQETHWYKKGKDYTFESSMGKWRFAVVRQSDGKLLGETVSYGRGGGDLPGPWHPSGFSCPENNVAGPNALLRAVFINSNVSGE